MYKQRMNKAGFLLNFLKQAVFDWRLWLLFLSLQLPAMRAFYKYLPESFRPFIPLYLIFMFFAYSIILRSRLFFKIIKPAFDNWWLMFVMVLAVLLANYLFYPILDSLKLYMRGSDQDDGLITAGVRLISGLYPYSVKTYLGTPISPGPGWVILALPFIASGVYFMLIPFWLGMAAILIKAHAKSVFKANLFIFLCMSSPAFWETMFMGSDMFALGALFIFCVFLIYYKMGKNLFWGIASMVLLAFASTSRIVFIYLIPLGGIFIWKKGKHRFLKYAVFSFAVAILLHLLFYFWNPSGYSPLHLLGKGDRLMSADIKLLAIVSCLAIAILTAKKTRDNYNSWVFYLWLCVAIPLFFLSWGDLKVVRHYNFAGWEGANYLLTAMPIYLTYFVNSLSIPPEK